jgi:hypothetical protein
LLCVGDEKNSLITLTPVPLEADVVDEPEVEQEVIDPDIKGPLL